MTFILESEDEDEAFDDEEEDGEGEIEHEDGMYESFCKDDHLNLSRQC